jgi:hypothetical protein
MLVMKLFNMQFSPTSCHLISFGPNILITLFSNSQSVYVPPVMSETKFHTIILNVFLIIFLRDLSMTIDGFWIDDSIYCTL